VGHRAANAFQYTANRKERWESVYLNALYRAVIFPEGKHVTGHELSSDD